jgi:hypothetical protein
MEAIRSPETLVLTRAIRRNVPEDGILQSYLRENLRSYIALTGWALKRRCNVFPVRYELGFYIPEDGILHNYRRESLKSYLRCSNSSRITKAQQMLVHFTGQNSASQTFAHNMQRPNLLPTCAKCKMHKTFFFVCVYQTPFAVQI